MNKDNIIFIGMDTHKDFCENAYCLDSRDSTPQPLGRITTTKLAITKLARQFQSKYPSATLHFVYEAGPCGYWIYRLLTKLGHVCYIVAPSLIPKAPGDKVKTDKRDALKLTRLLKNADLQPIYVPEPEDEAVRDLSRIRETAMHDIKKAKARMKLFLLRNNILYGGSSRWGPKHRRWLTELILPHPAQQIVLQECISTLNERFSRLERLDNELKHQVVNWRYFPVVKALQAMRGIKLIVATGMIAELGDLNLFDHPRKLMSYLGLVPSEYSSGSHRRLGPITKCGNSRARRLLVEGAHAYRYPARISTEIQKRQEGLPPDISAIAWKAQLRLCKRYQRLMHRGKHRNVVVTAIAREMSAYIWQISKHIALPPVNPKQRLVRVPR
ncbi:MAG: transposase [Arenicella sp.]|jgi:transposase